MGVKPIVKYLSTKDFVCELIENPESGVSCGAALRGKRPGEMGLAVIF